MTHLWQKLALTCLIFNKTRKKLFESVWIFNFKVVLKSFIKHNSWIRPTLPILPTIVYSIGTKKKESLKFFYVCLCAHGVYIGLKSIMKEYFIFHEFLFFMLSFVFKSTFYLCVQKNELKTRVGCVWQRFFFFKKVRLLLNNWV